MDQQNPDPPSSLEPEDYYYDGEYIVFTAAYHLKRGSCCGSGCRHCPYRGSAEDRNPQE
jgi:Family of unknown function (DUF5522)